MDAECGAGVVAGRSASDGVGVTFDETAAAEALGAAEADVPPAAAALRECADEASVHAPSPAGFCLVAASADKAGGGAEAPAVEPDIAFSAGACVTPAGAAHAGSVSIGEAVPPLTAADSLPAAACVETIAADSKATAGAAAGGAVVDPKVVADEVAGAGADAGAGTPDGVDAPEVVEDVEPTADMLSGSESVAPAGLSAGPDRGSPDEPEGGASVYPESAVPAVGLRVPELVGASFDGLAEVPAAERHADGWCIASGARPGASPGSDVVGKGGEEGMIPSPRTSGIPGSGARATASSRTSCCSRSSSRAELANSDSTSPEVESRDSVPTPPRDAALGGPAKATPPMLMEGASRRMEGASRLRSHSLVLLSLFLAGNAPLLLLV